MPGMNGEPTIEELKRYAMLLEKAKQYLRTFSEQISTEKRMEQQKEFFKLSDSFRDLSLIKATGEPLNDAVSLLRNSPPTYPAAYATIQEHLTNADKQFEHYRKTHSELSMTNVHKQLIEFYTKTDQ